MWCLCREVSEKDHYAGVGQKDPEQRITGCSGSFVKNGREILR